MLAAKKKTTVEEFLQMEFEGEDAYYELINGEIVKKYPSALRYRKPSHLFHQEISQNINFEMSKYVRSKNLGKIFVAPTDVYLDEQNYVVPDLLFVSKKKSKILDYDGGIVRGVPDLIVEIFAPSTIFRDRFDKKSIYEKAGVKEYWIVDPANHFIEICGLRKGVYESFSYAAVKGKVASKVLKGLELEVKDLFSE